MLRVANTLLGASVAQRQARFVSDVGLYMQCCPRPARDIFTRASRVVSSIVVVPLIAGDAPPLGALYFALDTPCEFANIQETLLVRVCAARAARGRGVAVPCARNPWAAPRFTATLRRLWGEGPC
jgi:hypothetical protein